MIFMAFLAHTVPNTLFLGTRAILPEIWDGIAWIHFVCAFDVVAFANHGGTRLLKW
jgi:hypothetical protein